MSNPLYSTVQIKRLLDVDLPAYQTDGAAGFDLAAGEDCTIPPNGHKLVRTGLAISCPSGHFLIITPRSSLYPKKRLLMANAPGIIDSDYSGDDDEVYLSLLNPAAFATVDIAKGDRLANGIFMPYSRVEFREVEHMGASRGGFGSTGGL